jgi:hypothetical protein
MKTIFLAALLVGGSALAVQAESFTFKAVGSMQNSVMVTGDDGKPIGGVFLSGTADADMASGKKLRQAYSCEEHTALPGGIFTYLGVCTVSDDTGKFYELFGCNDANKAMTEADCWAGATGTDGAYKGKHGRATWHSKPGADGKTGESLGQGAWND